MQNKTSSHSVGAKKSGRRGKTRARIIGSVGLVFVLSSFLFFWFWQPPLAGTWVSGTAIGPMKLVWYERIFDLKPNGTGVIYSISENLTKSTDVEITDFPIEWKFRRHHSGGTLSIREQGGDGEYSVTDVLRWNENEWAAYDTVESELVWSRYRGYRDELIDIDWK